MRASVIGMACFASLLALPARAESRTDIDIVYGMYSGLALFVSGDAVRLRPQHFERGVSMGLRHLLCGVLAAAWAVTASASQRPQVESDQQVLIALERGWNEAFYRKDAAFIKNILADEFMATYDDGSRGDKAKELALAAEFNQEVESAIQDEFTVRVYRDTAVVWFTLRLVGMRQGQRADLTLRYTDVWVMRDGRWQCVSTQSTRVNPR